jgi:hypothetical protein
VYIKLLFDRVQRRVAHDVKYISLQENSINDLGFSRVNSTHRYYIKVVGSCYVACVGIAKSVLNGTPFALVLLDTRAI